MPLQLLGSQVRPTKARRRLGDNGARLARCARLFKSCPKATRPPLYAHETRACLHVKVAPLCLLLHAAPVHHALLTAT